MRRKSRSEDSTWILGLALLRVLLWKPCPHAAGAPWRDHVYLPPSPTQPSRCPSPGARLSRWFQPPVACVSAAFSLPSRGLRRVYRGRPARWALAGFLTRRLRAESSDCCFMLLSLEWFVNTAKDNSGRVTAHSTPGAGRLPWAGFEGAGRPEGLEALGGWRSTACPPHAAGAEEEACRIWGKIEALGFTTASGLACPDCVTPASVLTSPFPARASPGPEHGRAQQAPVCSW